MFGWMTVEEVRFTKELSDIKTNEVNNDLVLECELSKEGLKVEWFKDSKKITRSDNDYDIQVEGRIHRLLIKKASSKNIGTYRADHAALTTSAKVSIEGNLSFLKPGTNYLRLSQLMAVYY